MTSCANVFIGAWGCVCTSRRLLYTRPHFSWYRQLKNKSEVPGVIFTVELHVKTYGLMVQNSRDVLYWGRLAALVVCVSAQWGSKQRIWWMCYLSFRLFSLTRLLYSFFNVLFYLLLVSCHLNFWTLGILLSSTTILGKGAKRKQLFMAGIYEINSPSNLPFPSTNSGPFCNIFAFKERK